MAQPFDRKGRVGPAGAVDQASGQFWVDHPWNIVAEGHNLSGFERNATYLNLAGRGFADVSFLSATDNDGDGRSIVPADIDNDGRLDMIVRQASGGALLVFRNQLPQQHWLRVSLRGRKSNGLGIGARLVAEIGERRLVRELYPANTYYSQQPAEVHFGLADAIQVDRLTIHWPSGNKQTISRIAADQHLRVTEPDSPPTGGNR